MTNFARIICSGFPIILNLFQELTRGLGRTPVDYLLGAKVNAGKILKQVTHDK